MMDERLDMLNLNSAQAAPEFEPDAEVLAHAGSPDTYLERLAEAEKDYSEAQEAFLATDPNTEAIMDAAEYVEIAGKALITRALTLFHITGATREDKQHALEIVDRVTLDSNTREQTCNNYFHKEKAKKETTPKERLKLYKEKVKRMHFLDRCMRTQSHYTEKFEKESDPQAEEIAVETVQSEKAHRARKRIPAGHRFCPPHIFPHDPIPWGERLPLPPEVYRKFREMQPEELEFDEEHSNFVLPADYVSEDGRIDSESIVWDYEKHTVTMKYVGEEPVTWDFKQYLDPRDVPKPTDWCALYHRRLYLQEARERPDWKGLRIRN